MRQIQNRKMNKEPNYLAIADFLVNSLGHHSLGEAIDYLEEEFKVSGDDSLILITDYLIRYSIEPIIMESEILDFIKIRLPWVSRF
jgi:hypothetical protein